MSRRRAVTQTLLFTDYQHYMKYTCFKMDRYARSTPEIPTWGFNIWCKVQFRGPGGRSNIPSTRAQHLRCCQRTASPFMGCGRFDNQIATSRNLPVLELTGPARASQVRWRLAEMWRVAFALRLPVNCRGELSYFPFINSS